MNYGNILDRTREFVKNLNLKFSGGWTGEQVKAGNELIVSRFGGDNPPLFIVKRKFTITYTIIRQTLCLF